MSDATICHRHTTPPRNPQSLNRYAYVMNNPTTRVDPLGLWTWQVGNCYFDTVASYVNGQFQGYDTEPVGCQYDAGFSSSDWYNGSYYSSGGASNGGGGVAPGSVGATAAPKPAPTLNCTVAPPQPPAPPGVNVHANMQAVQEILQAETLAAMNPTGSGMGYETAGGAWFLAQVRPGGPWDYKALGGQYTAFGNFNFGATCNAMGLSLEGCQRGAGAQAYGTAAMNLAFGSGKWTAGPGNPIGSPAPDGGMSVYGDQAIPVENQSVIAGFGYAQWSVACQK